ncbi:MAG TPA: hypothetical protein PLT08_18730 [Anaerolineales bacterium]|nr:hypothetical protein [Anaerolineales bacterium]
MADKKCPQCGLWSTASALRCDCGYDFENGIVARLNNKLELHHYLKYPAFPFLVGFGVASIHFLIAHFLLDSQLFCTTSLLSVIFLAPGFTLLLVVPDFVHSLASNMSLDFNLVMSSILYGTIGGFLGSGKIHIQAIGIVLAICFLILPICFVILIALVAGGCA